MNPPFDISIVIPAKDEQERLPAFLSRVIEHCKKSSYRYEIIVVDDGSTDQTSQAAQAFQKNFDSLKIIRLEKNKGKGHAVKCGLLQAQGRIGLFLDADGSIGPEEIDHNVVYMDQDNYDIVIGSRALAEKGKSVNTKFYRKLMSVVFSSFVHLFLIKNIQDTQCGFKMFRQNAIKPIFNQLHLDGFGFDLEVLFLAQKLGFKIKETPVNWNHVAGSKVRLFRDSSRMFINIFQIRKWHQY